ncbi:cysteine desulfurase family protein [Pseudochelatococcus lubricantis]|uniref:cysteine desulfurase family protein n=1 Tax=Pseudochelatococcus lubricantis TaxID=1538102 RepID=UPI0035E57AC2
MTRERVYLDFNATAPVRPEVLEAVVRALGAAGNASSVHAEGRAAHKRIEDARAAVAALAGARAEDVIFTGCGSEANTMALTPQLRVSGSCAAGACAVGVARPVTRLFVGATEHPSVLSGGRFAPEDVEAIPADSNGLLRQDWLAERLSRFSIKEPGAAFLVSVQAANSETGVLQPLSEIAALVHGAGGIVHTDAVQAAGRMALDIGALGVDMLTLSAHKLGGPQGVGALVLAPGAIELGTPLVRGGGQERGRRAGTENAAGIAGFGVAAELALREISAYPARLKILRDGFELRLGEVLPQAVIFGREAARIANTSAFAVPGLRAETLLMALDLAGMAVSSGSACSSGKVRRSHVLAEMGVAPELAEGALRVSFGWASRAEDVDSFVAALEKVVGMLISRQRGRHAA